MKTILGHNITLLRKRKGLTLQGLADLIGTSKSYIWELENKSNHPSVYLASKIAHTLGVSTDKLIDKPIREEGRIV
jgi:transcriptional regulator with XRE-family HTH domain